MALFDVEVNQDNKHFDRVISHVRLSEWRGAKNPQHLLTTIEESIHHRMGLQLEKKIRYF